MHIKLAHWLASRTDSEMFINDSATGRLPEEEHLVIWAKLCAWVVFRVILCETKWGASSLTCLVGRRWFVIDVTKLTRVDVTTVPVPYYDKRCK